MSTVALGSVADIEMGQAPAGETYNETGAGLPLLAGASDLGETVPSPSRYTSAPTKVSREGDIIVCIRATIGDLNWSDREYCLGRGVAALRAKSDRVDRGYLWWATFSGRAELAARGRGATFKQVNRNDIATLPIFLPPLTEQRRIASILDQADALRRKRRNAVAMARASRQAMFADLFGDPAINSHRWATAPLGALSEIFSDGPFGSNLKSEHYVERGVRVVRLQNIGVGEFVDEDRAFISEAHFASLRRHECRPGDILVATLGDPNLRACIQPASIEVALNKADCVQMRCDQSKALPEFVEALLNHPSTERMAQSKIQGQTRLRISMGRLRELVVPVPPVQLQQKFSRISAGAKRVELEMNFQLDGLNALFDSLQHRAFSGNMMPAKGGAQEPA